MRTTNSFKLFVVLVLLLGSFNLYAVKNDDFGFGPFSEDVVLTFDITPIANWSNFYIKPPIGDPYYAAGYFQTRIVFGGGTLIIFNGTYQGGLEAKNFTFETDGTKYNFKITLYTSTSPASVTVEAKQDGATDWIVIFDKIDQAWGVVPIGLVQNDPAYLNISNISTIVSSATDNFRSKNSGNWSNQGIWETSLNGSTDWISSTIAPESSAASINITAPHNVTLDQNITVSNININSGAAINLNAGKQLTINTALTNNGTFTSKSADGVGTATIKTPETVSGSGITIVEQFISSAAIGATGRNWYISSPLSAATSSTITTATGNGLVYYDGTTPWANAGTTMDVMKGYIAKSPLQNTTIQFTGGSLNTGNQSVTNLPVGFNLVGNPYASYLDWNQATKTAVSTSIWYRSKSTGSYVFQTYNVAGEGVGVNGGTNIIPPMQSFWIKTTNATNSLGFTNAMRSHQDQSNAANLLKAPVKSLQKLARLEIASGTNKDATVIYFNPNALNTFDDYDSQKMLNDEAGAPELYTVTDNKNLVINGFSDIQMNTEIPLGFRTGLTNPADSYTLKATQLQNFDPSTELILIDKENNNTETVMNEGSEFTFTSAAVNSTDRFSLVFRTKGTATDSFTTHDNIMQLTRNNKQQIVVNCTSEVANNATISVYNTAGQKIKEQPVKFGSTIVHANLKAGVYFVKLFSEGKTSTMKIAL